MRYKAGQIFRLSNEIGFGKFFNAATVGYNRKIDKIYLRKKV